MHVTCLALLFVLDPGLCGLEIAVTVTGCVWEQLSSMSHCQPRCSWLCWVRRCAEGWSWFGAFLGKAGCTVCKTRKGRCL